MQTGFWVVDLLGGKGEVQSGIGELGGVGERGWVGDSPFIFLDCRRMRSLGWKPRLTIRQGIVATLQFLQRNQWVLETRA